MVTLCVRLQDQDPLLRQVALLPAIQHLCYMASDGVHPHTIFPLDNKRSRSFSQLCAVQFLHKMGALTVQYLHTVGSKIWILLSPTLLNIYQLILVKKHKLAERMLFVLLLDNPEKTSLLAEKNNNNSENMWRPLFFFKSEENLSVFLEEY